MLLIYIYIQNALFVTQTRSISAMVDDDENKETEAKSTTVAVTRVSAKVLTLWKPDS